MLILLACAEPDVIHASADTATKDTDDTGEEPVVDGCRATPPEADRVRTVFVSLPYTKQGNKADTWATLSLSETGTLGEPQVFTMARATMGEATFTPDGTIGVAPLEDGTVAVFTGDGDVIAASFDGGFYAGRVVPDPTGEGFWVIDGNWQNNGGGVYWLPIDCETGEPSAATRVVEAKLPADLLIAGTRAMVVGREVPGTDAGADVAWMEWSATPTLLSGADAFGDDEEIVSDAAMTADGAWALIGDNSEFSGVPTRVARVSIDGDTVTAEGTVDVEDPFAIVTAPEGTLALVVSGYGNAVYTLDAATGDLAEVDYVGGSPQLPGPAVTITRGALAGAILLSENQGIRQLHFDGDTVVDDGLYPFGDGIEWIPGAIGVTP